MIEAWSLPGPARLASHVVDTLEDGYQCVPVGSVPPGFRRAVEALLTARRGKLEGIIYDDPGLLPEALIRREASSSLDRDALAAGIWWVEDVAAERIATWSEQARRLGERMRHLRPNERLQIVLPLPAGSAVADSLGVSVVVGNALGRIDLEVAARYLAAGAGADTLLTRLRIASAVEMALPLLPDPRALDALTHWMDAPKSTFCDPAALAAHARADGRELRLPEFELWRLQHAVLLAEIERHRIEIVQAHRNRWSLPYEVPAGESQPAKWVSDAEMLELRHLCGQLRQAGEPWSSPLARRLRMLRDLRNALSHLEPAALADFLLLSEDGRCGT